VTQLVHSGIADIGISGVEATLPGIERIKVGGVDLIPVAAPHHPLATERAHAPGAARDFVQLVLTDRSTLTEGRDFSVIGVRTWRLADLGSKHALLLAGIGWGNMPEPMVREDLAAGRLQRLNLSEWSGGFLCLPRNLPRGYAAGTSGWLDDAILRRSGSGAYNRAVRCALTPHTAEPRGRPADGRLIIDKPPNPSVPHPSRAAMAARSSHSP
jgi:DNA-binding transcriptional LysR family regulator